MTELPRLPGSPSRASGSGRKAAVGSWLNRVQVKPAGGCVNGEAACHRSERRAGGGGQPGRVAGSAVWLMKGVSMYVCHRGGQERGGLCVGGRIYILAWLTQEPSLTSEGALQLTALR